MDDPDPSPHDVLRAAVTVGLPGATVAEPFPLHRDVLAIAGNHRVQGLVWAALEAGVVTASDELREQALDAHVQALRGCLLAESWAVEALQALDRAGIEARALKGLAIAHLDHDDPSERIFGDADLLIRRADHEATLDALIAAGFARHHPAVRGWWERRYGKAVVLVPEGGGELDLHLAIAGGYFGLRIDHDALWASPGEAFDLAGQRAVALDRQGRLLHACCHAVLGGASGLRVRRDVAQLILVRGADWRAVASSAARDGADAVVAAAIRTTWDDLRLDPVHPAAMWADEHQADPAQQRALDAYRDRRDGWAGEGRGTLAALGPVDTTLFLAGLAWPSRANRRARQRSWHDHLARGRRLLRRVRR